MQSHSPGEVCDAFEILGAGPADDAVDFVAFFKQEIRQVAAVLPGDARDQCALHERTSPVLGTAHPGENGKNCQLEVKIGQATMPFASWLTSRDLSDRFAYRDDPVPGS